MRRSWFKPTRRRLVLVAAFFGLLALMSAAPEPLIQYNGGSGEPVSLEGIPNPIFQQLDVNETAAYAEELRTKLEEARVPIVGELKSTLTTQQNERSNVMLRLMWALTLVGLFMLAAPIVLIWRYGLMRLPELLIYSSISSALFLLVGSILVGLYALTRYTNGLVSTAYNPQLSVTESLFDFLISRSDSLAEIGPTIIEPTIVAMEEGPTSPALQIILENAESFSSTLNVFIILARVAQGINILFSFLPLALLLVAFVLFIRNSIPTLKEIVRLPGRAAQRQPNVVRNTVRLTIQNLKKESLYALGIIGVLLVLTLIVSSVGRGAIEPALEIILNYIIAAMIYAQTEAGAQPGLILFCTGIALAFLVMVLAMTTLAAVLFLWRSSSVLRTVTRAGMGLRNERRFWLRGTGGLVWAMFLPVLYALAASPAIALWGQWAVDTRTWGVMFGLIPLALVAGFFVAFWAGNGFKTLMFVRRYQPVVVGAGAGGAAAVAAGALEGDGEEEVEVARSPDEPSVGESFDISA